MEGKPFRSMTNIQTPSPEHIWNPQEYDRGFFDINKLMSIASHSKNLSLQYHESRSSFKAISYTCTMSYPL